LTSSGDPLGKGRFLEDELNYQLIDSIIDVFVKRVKAEAP